MGTSDGKTIFRMKPSSSSEPMSPKTVNPKPLRKPSLQTPKETPVPRSPSKPRTQTAKRNSEEIETPSKDQIEKEELLDDSEILDSMVDNLENLLESLAADI